MELNEQNLKKLKFLFFGALAGVAVTLAGTIYTAVEKSKQQTEINQAVPVPAFR